MPRDMAVLIKNPLTPKILGQNAELCHTNHPIYTTTL